MKRNLKRKVIIDSDFGIDDCAMLLLALTDERLDVKLLSTVSGNTNIDIGTNNMLHLLEKLHIYNIPVVKGYAKPLHREPKRATFMHTETGMGGYIPKPPEKLKVLDCDAIEKMYEVIKENPNEITILAIGPLTNIAALILKHPDVIKLVKEIIFMGGNPWGNSVMPFYDSFNASSDPEALDIVVKCGIKNTMAASFMGRCKCHLSAADVFELRAMNKIGEFMYEMYTTYWEPNFPDKRVATNDTIAYMYLMYPKLFKRLRGDILINEAEAPGRTYFQQNKNGKNYLLVDCKRPQYVRIIKHRVKLLKNHAFD